MKQEEISQLKFRMTSHVNHSTHGVGTWVASHNGHEFVMVATAPMPYEPVEYGQECQRKRSSFRFMIDGKRVGTRSRFLKALETL